MPVDGAKVGEVEAACRDAFGGPLGDELSLQAVKPHRVGEAQPVP